jgi:hypothetical protein
VTPAISNTEFLIGTQHKCIIFLNRSYPQEKFIKVKLVKAPIQRRPETGGFVNEAYDITVINKSGATTPETVEDVVSKPCIATSDNV